MNSSLTEFLRLLKKAPSLTPQQYRTLRGQAISGNLAGAEKGYARLMERRLYHADSKSQRGPAQPRRV